MQTKVINCNSAKKSVSYKLCTQKLSLLWRNFAIFSTDGGTDGVTDGRTDGRTNLLIEAPTTELKKLSLTSCAHKSYHSFDAILRFFQLLSDIHFRSMAFENIAYFQPYLWGRYIKAKCFQQQCSDLDNRDNTTILLDEKSFAKSSWPYFLSSSH